MTGRERWSQNWSSAAFKYLKYIKDLYITHTYGVRDVSLSQPMEIELFSCSSLIIFTELVDSERPAENSGSSESLSSASSVAIDWLCSAVTSLNK